MGETQCISPSFEEKCVQALNAQGKNLPRGDGRRAKVFLPVGQAVQERRLQETRFGIGWNVSVQSRHDLSVFGVVGVFGQDRVKTMPAMDGGGSRKNLVETVESQ